MIKIFASNKYTTVYYEINDQWMIHNRYGFLSSGFNSPNINENSVIKEFTDTYKLIIEFIE